jgi:hypothetical protein
MYVRMCECICTDACICMRMYAGVLIFAYKFIGVICVVCMYLYVCAYVCVMCMFVYACVYVCEYVYVCMLVCRDLCTYVRMYLCMYVHISVCMYVIRTYVYVLMCICFYCTDLFLHTYLHTYMHARIYICM